MLTFAVLAVAVPSFAAVAPYLLTMLNWILATFGVAIISWVAAKIPGPTQELFAWLKGQAGKVHNQYAAGILQRMSDLLLQKVLMVEQTEIQLLKDQAAAGKLDSKDLPDLLKKAKDKAIDAAKVDASAHGLMTLALGLFMGDASALDKWMGETVEAHVATLPPSGLQTKAAPKLP